MINLMTLILAFFFMEFVAWSSHKYVMHGFLWKWHKDHHRLDGNRAHSAEADEKRFEKNDLFFLIYATPSVILLVSGLLSGYSLLTYIGAGIALYGLTYFIIHDVFIHRRLNIPFLEKIHGRYITALLKAHKAHHNPKSKRDFQNFGLLIFPARYLKA